MALDNSAEGKQSLEKQIAVLKGAVGGTEKDKSTLEQGLVKLTAEYESVVKKMKTLQDEQRLEEKQRQVSWFAVQSIGKASALEESL